MYMNPYQRYIRDLLNEYGSLLKRQLLQMVNFRFNTNFKDIESYTHQMCSFADYVIVEVGKEQAMAHKDTEIDFDIIRSFDVMLAFLPKLLHHRRSRDLISIAFFVGTDEMIKEVYVLPVGCGNERVVSSYANDKFTDEKNEVVIFLLEDKKQLKLMHTNKNHKFALIEQSGVKFIKHNI